ncbi:MAG: hypothetical protein O4804_18325 [Trichodesmium sp. St11_bin5]|nr:hypothetical protein [Trichodesmium sp. St11_bin5]
MKDSYFLSRKILLPRCWIESIFHKVMNEYQSCETAINGVKALTTR